MKYVVQQLNTNEKTLIRAPAKLVFSPLRVSPALPQPRIPSLTWQMHSTFFSRLFFKTLVSMSGKVRVSARCMCAHARGTHMRACRAGGIVTYGGQRPTLRNGTYPAHNQHLPLPSPASIPLSHLVSQRWQQWKCNHCTEGM